MVCKIGLLPFLFAVVIAFEGESCDKDGVAGTCINVRDCPEAVVDLKNKRHPQICGITGFDPIVCCVGEFTTPSRTEVSNQNAGCAKLPSSVTAEKNGQKAWDKCIEYQEQLVYPCERGVALTGELTRANHCTHDAQEPLLTGGDAARGEYPHVVLLGFGDTAASALWQCTGTLISDKFILTVAHCSKTPRNGDVRFAVVSPLTRSEVNSSKVYTIKRIIKHPDYKPGVKYNDIALLETDTPVKLDRFTKPACLHVGDDSYETTTAVTWGITGVHGELHETLQKVLLTKVSHEECAVSYPPARAMPQGIRKDSHLCYRSRNGVEALCQGTSGSPLQVKNKRIHCMYTVVGLTSFGKGCAGPDPDVMMGVRAFVPWIESVVWP